MSRKSASVAYLSSIARAIVPCSARASTAWLRRIGVGEVVVDHVGRVGTGLRQGLLAPRAVLDDQPQRVRDCRRRHRPGRRPRRAGGGPPPSRVGGWQQLVDGRRIDPEQDQRLVERQGVSQGVEDRSIQAHQRESIEPLEPERVEGERAVIVERAAGPREGRPRRARG